MRAIVDVLRKENNIHTKDIDIPEISETGIPVKPVIEFEK